MVKDGSYLIGTCAMITKHDTKIVYQSHLYKIRVAKNNKLKSVSYTHLDVYKRQAYNNIEHVQYILGELESDRGGYS